MLQDLTPVERFVIYRAWGKRCVWCKRPINFCSLEIDHLVPKSLPEGKLEQALADYGLPSSFDIYALPNLVPSCRPCNGSKGDRLVRGAPLVVAMLDKAQERAPVIAERVARFTRSRALGEVVALLEVVQPSAEEMKSLNRMVKGDKSPHLPASCYEPDPPKLKRSKHKLGGVGSDKQQMLLMLGRWILSHERRALDIVQETFDGGDTPPQKVWMIKVNSLAYAKEMGDFLADVTFNVEYLYVKEDYSAEAEAEHCVNLWITLDHARLNIVDVVADNLLPQDIWQWL